MNFFIKGKVLWESSGENAIHSPGYVFTETIQLGNTPYKATRNHAHVWDSLGKGEPDIIFHITSKLILLS